MLPNSLSKNLQPQESSPKEPQPRGPAGLASVLLLLGLIVAGIWTWNHLDFDTQDFIIDEVIPVLFSVSVLSLVTWVGIRKVRTRRNTQRRRDQLIEAFSKERAPRKKFELAIEIVELNNYELEGLEATAPEMAKACIATFKSAIGDKQHRIRGMAASHLGILQHRESIPLLIRALEDDHAYVRGNAALALGRMRAQEAKDKLAITMKEDWDQTVRSRSREAFERIQ